MNKFGVIILRENEDGNFYVVTTFGQTETLEEFSEQVNGVRNAMSNSLMYQKYVLIEDFVEELKTYKIDVCTSPRISEHGIRYLNDELIS